MAGFWRYKYRGTRLSTTLANILVMRRWRRRQHGRVAPLPLASTDQPCYKYAGEEEGDPCAGGKVTDGPLSSSPHGPSLLQGRVQKRDFAKSTEDKRTHSSDSTGSSSSFAHRKYQPAIFTWTRNKYHLNDPVQLQNTAELRVTRSSGGLQSCSQTFQAVKRCN